MAENACYRFHITADMKALREKRYATVRSKVLWTIATGILLLFALLYGLTTQILTKSYLSIEQEAVIQNLDRANNAIEDVISNQYLHLNDWSPWDELYTYTLDRNKTFETNTLFSEGIIRQDQNALTLSDMQGNIFFAHYLDLKNEKEIASSSLVANLAPYKSFLIHTSTTTSTRGLLLFPEGPALLVSKPVLHNDNSGPVHASVSILRYLDEDKIQNLSDITHLDIKLFELRDGVTLPADVVDARSKLSKDTPNLVVPASDSVVRGYRLLYDLYDKPILVLRIETPRPVFAQGQKTVFYFMVLGAIVLIMFALGITGLLERLVISRFVKLSQDVEKINTQKDISIRVHTGVQDDMGRLGAKINQMLTWLSAAQKAEDKAKKEIVGLLDTISHAKEEAEHMVIQRTHELSDEKARLLASINSLSFGFVIADLDNTIIVRNPSLAAILEMETIPTSISDVAHVLKNGESTKTTFDPVSFVREVVNTKKTMEKSGVSFGKKFLRFLCAPIFADEASATSVSTEVIGYVFIVEDITDSKNMERSREEFFSIASHELRTPLTAIRWNTDMLLNMKEKITKKDEEEMLRDVHNSSIRLIDIVGEFLEVSRLEQGKVHVESSLFSMGELVQKVSHRMREMAEKRGLTLTVEAQQEGESSEVYADQSNTEQVLENLIGNAIKFTQKGTITVRMEHNGPYLKVSVTDTGAGISEHNQTRLFKKFQQAGEDMLARDVNQSTGLGLYISKLLITAMGGTIALEKSVLGKGSTFVFMLPTKAPKA